MTKKELAAAIKMIFPDLREWYFRDSDKSVYPRALYWGYVKSAVRSSGTAYVKTETVQISVFSLFPEEVKVNELEDLLLSLGFNSDIYVEFNEDDRVFHYYMAVECER